MHSPSEPKTLILDNIRLVHWVLPLDGIVDELGQYAKADWPGKLKSAAGLAERRRTEEIELKAPSPVPDRDRYGGWTRGPTLRASGFFRTERLNGQWWLVTPEGHLFWSMGMDVVSTYCDTITTGREHMFKWLPAADDPLARHAGITGKVYSGPVQKGSTVNYLTANLQRKFGEDYEKAWFDLSLTRLISWGFNTIGNWSDTRLYGNRRIPYVATVSIEGEHGLISSGADYWGRMHDPYDPRFAADTAKALQAVAQQVKDDPWCLGWFVDNELSWGSFDEPRRYGLAYGALAASQDVPAKKAFIAQLKAKYVEVSRLNAAWGTHLADWNALQAPFTPPAQPPKP